MGPLAKPTHRSRAWHSQPIWSGLLKLISTSTNVYAGDRSLEHTGKFIHVLVELVAELVDTHKSTGLGVTCRLRQSPPILPPSIVDVLRDVPMYYSSGVEAMLAVAE